MQLQTKGVVCHLPSFAEQECTLQALRASTNVQPCKILSSLVLEFKQLLNQPDSSPLPPHAGKLSTPKLGYVASTPENHITVGVHFSQEEFLQEALRLQHPTEQQALFPREVRTNVSYLTSKTVHQVARERTEQVRRWTTRATELLDEERKKKASLSPRIAEVLKDKRLCLFDLLIREAGHEDLTLVDDLKKGGFAQIRSFLPEV